MKQAGTGTRITAGITLAGLLALSSCVVDPIPQPPSMDVSMVSIESDGAGLVTMSGEPGATSPRARLDFFNFNLEASSTGLFTTLATDDGGFEIVMPGWRLNRYRVAVTTQDGSTVTVDFHGNYDGSATALALPLEGCFDVSGLLVDFGEVPVGSQEFRAVDLSNSCGAGSVIRITDIYLSDMDNFILFHSTIGTSGIEVSDGQTEQIGMYFSPLVEGEIVRTMFVGMTDGVETFEARIVLRGTATTP